VKTGVREHVIETGEDLALWRLRLNVGRERPPQTRVWPVLPTRTELDKSV